MESPLPQKREGNSKGSRERRAKHMNERSADAVLRPKAVAWLTGVWRNFRSNCS